MHRADPLARSARALHRSKISWATGQRQDVNFRSVTGTSFAPSLAAQEKIGIDLLLTNRAAPTELQPASHECADALRFLAEDLKKIWQLSRSEENHANSDHARSASKIMPTLSGMRGY